MNSGGEDLKEKGAEKKEDRVLSDTQKESYLQERNRWIRLTVYASGMPVVLSVFIGLITKDPLFRLIGNGDIVLASFALILTMSSSIFTRKHSDNEQLEIAKFWCDIVKFIQIIAYFTIKLSCRESESRQYPIHLFLLNIDSLDGLFILSSICTGVILIGTIVACIYALKAIYSQDDSEVK